MPEGRMIRFETIDSTNAEIIRRADAGAAAGLVVTADCQTAGRGRQGRVFESPGGRGLYLSMLLRPEGGPVPSGLITGRAAVAAVRAIASVCAAMPDIKWLNDLQIQGRKICGILAEAGTDRAGGRYVVLGIGINLTQTAEDFSPAVRTTAGSLAQFGFYPDRAALQAALVSELDLLLRPDSGAYLSEYRARCITIGQSVLANGRRGVAAAVGDDFSLRVRFAGGMEEPVTAGEVLSLTSAPEAL